MTQFFRHKNKSGLTMLETQQSTIHLPVRLPSQSESTTALTDSLQFVGHRNVCFVYVCWLSGAPNTNRQQ